MPRISDMARQRLMHMILEDVGLGLVDHQIMDKRGINARTFYRYKKLIGKQCQKILDKQSEEEPSHSLPSRIYDVCDLQGSAASFCRFAG
jgi:hypothetical protein